MRPYFILLLATLLPLCKAFDGIEAIAVGVFEYEPFVKADGTGFENLILNKACQIMNVTCDITALPSLESRITALQEGSADLTLGVFSVTPERAQLVDFIHPHHFTSGAALFAPSEDALKLASRGWKGLKGKSVCAETVYYAIPYLTEQYSINFLQVGSIAEGVSKTQAGDCIGVIQDSVLISSVSPLVFVDIPLQAVAPYAFAVPKGNSHLKTLIAGALVQMMQNGNSSDILALEQENVIALGLPTNQDLQAAVASISNFTGVAVIGADAACSGAASSACRKSGGTGTLWMLVLMVCGASGLFRARYLDQHTEDDDGHEEQGAKPSSSNNSQMMMAATDNGSTAARHTSSSLGLSSLLTFTAVIIVLLSTAGGAYAAPSLKSITVGVWRYDRNITTSVQKYEAAVMNATCKILDVRCTFVELPRLEQRITSLQDGSVQMTFGELSVTPDRADIVDFVHPFIYESGTGLYAFSTNVANISAGGWEGLRGQTVCAVKSYYAIPTLQEKYGMVILETEDFASGQLTATLGGCVAVLVDSTAERVQFVDVPLEAVSPYAFAVAKGNTFLRTLVSGALVQLMEEKRDSQLLKFEEEYITSKGIPRPPNADLNAVVTAVSNFTGVVITESSASGRTTC